jgi:DHA1 family multidrug resistance protein-like MFS transporter
MTARATAVALPRGDLALLLTAVFAVSLGYGVVLPVLPFFLARVASESDISWHTGMLSAVYMLAIFIGAPLWGRIADRTGRRPVILVGLAGFSVALLVFGFASSLWLGYAARLAGGMFAAAVAPVALAYVSDTSTVTSRAPRFAWMSAASVLGFLAGPSLGGWLAGESVTERVPAAALPFLAAAGIGALVWVFAWWRLSESPRASAPANMQTPARTTWLLFVLSLLVMFGLGGFEVGLTLQGQQRLGMTPAQVGLMFFECSLVMAVVEVLLFAPLAHRLAGRAAVTAALVAMAVGLSWLATATTSDGLWWPVGVVAASSGFLIPLLTYRVSLAAGVAQAATLGKQTAATSLGQALGSAAAGWLFGSMGHRVLVWVKTEREPRFCPVIPGVERI